MKKIMCDCCKHKSIFTGGYSGDRTGTIAKCEKLDKGIKMIRTIDDMVDIYALDECPKNKGK